VDPNLRTILVDALWVLAIGVLLFRAVRWVLARGRGPTPQRQQRRQAIAAICEKRGMVPNPVDLSRTILALIPGIGPVYENSFASPDGSLWAADMWTLDENQKQPQKWNSFSMLVFAVPGLHLPYLGVTRKGQKIGSGLRGSLVELESIDFNDRFIVKSEDRRGAVMLLDLGMMQWLLDCDEVSFQITGGQGQALIRRSAEPGYQPNLVQGWHLPGQSAAPFSNPHKVEPVELELLFKFVDGFGPRVPELVRTEFGAGRTA
jgi:hypothetical protein